MALPTRTRTVRNTNEALMNCSGVELVRDLQYDSPGMAEIQICIPSYLLL